jgi:hypothetical protein
MNNLPDCVIRIPTTVLTDFFKLWLVFLKPLHHLQNRDMDILAALLKERYILSSKVDNPDLVDSIILKPDVRNKIMKKCGLKQAHMYAILRRLKKQGIIKNGKFNLKFIPDLKSPDCFKLMLLFDFRK